MATARFIINTSIFLISLWVILASVRCTSSKEILEESNANYIIASEKRLNMSTILQEHETAKIKKILSTILKFISSLTDILKPYLFFDVPGFDINWKTAEDAVFTFRDALARADPSTRTAGAASMIAIGAGAVVGPYIVEVIKSIVISIVGFFDNISFVSTGEAFGRSAMTDDVWNQLFQVTLEHMVE